MAKGKIPGYEVADRRDGYHYGFSDSSDPRALGSTTEAGSQDPIRERLNNNKRLSRLWHLRMRWGLGQENSPHYNFANTKECLQSIFSIDKKIIKKNLVWLNCNYSDGISNPYSQCNTTYHIKKTKKVWYPHGTIFLIRCIPVFNCLFGLCSGVSRKHQHVSDAIHTEHVPTSLQPFSRAIDFLLAGSGNKFLSAHLFSRRSVGLSLQDTPLHCHST